MARRLLCELNLYLVLPLSIKHKVVVSGLYLQLDVSSALSKARHLRQALLSFFRCLESIKLCRPLPAGRRVCNSSTISEARRYLH